MKPESYGVGSLGCAVAIALAAARLEAQSPRFTLGPGVTVPTGA
jgi:hypothetical protein